MPLRHFHVCESDYDCQSMYAVWHYLVHSWVLSIRTATNNDTTINDLFVCQHLIQKEIFVCLTVLALQFHHSFHKKLDSCQKISKENSITFGPMIH